MTDPQKQQQELPGNVNLLVEAVLEEIPMHRSFLESAISHAREDELLTLDHYLSYCVETGKDIAYLTQSYLTIVENMFREQVYFKKHGQYRHSTFEDVANDVYFNDEYMSYYMYGLAITTFLWPNHIDIHRFFNETLPKDKTGSYLEIGPGHGYFMMAAMNASSYEHFLGIDISETSIRLTREIIENFCSDKLSNVDLQCMDFLSSDLKAKSFDAIVMGEVLEHVEQPDIFMKRIAELAKDDAHIFVTTCITAPAIDHIYLFETTEEISRLFHECGLDILTPLILPYEGKSIEESLAERLPINVAYVLKKQN